MKAPRSHPTLLISGFAGGSLPFIPLQRTLRRRGIAADRWNSPLVYTASILEYAERLSLDILRFYGPEDPVTLVGWSMGGFISLQAALDPEAASCVRRIIAYGTPFEGTWAANAGIVLDSVGITHILEMTPGSAYLKRLRHDLAHVPRDWDFRAINGRFDALARGPLRSLPLESRLSGPFFHVSPIFDPRLHRLIGDLVLRP